MISFKLDQSEMAVKEEFSHFARRFLGPYAEEADRIADIPAELLRNPEALNYTRAFIPREFGGGYKSLATGEFEYALADRAKLRTIMCEEIGYGDAPLYVALPGPGLAEPVVRAFGTVKQQRKLFGIFQDGRPRWGAFAMSEPNAGSDVAAISTIAIRRGDRYILNGRKWFIGNGGRADWVVVFATINPKQGQFGIRAFAVNRGSAGFRVGQILTTMGMRAVPVAELIFEDCEVSEESLLSGQEKNRRGESFQAGMRTLHLMRPGVAAMAVGTARSAIDLLEEDVKVNGARHVLADKWRAMEERLLEMRREVDAVRLLCWEAACLYDAGKENSQQSSMAKAASAKVAMKVSTAAMEMGASIGITNARMATLERIFRNSKLFDIVEGTGDIQRLNVLATLLRGSHK